MKMVEIARHFGWGFLVAALTAGPGFAEQRTLVQSGHWRVVKTSGGGTASCTAEVTGDNNVAFYLVADSGKANNVVMKAVGGHWGVVNAQNGYRNYQIKITPGNKSVIRGARMFDSVWSYTLPHQSWSISFLSEIAQGTSFTMLEIRDREIMTIDIRGADKAIASFIECSTAIWPAQ